MAAEWFTGLSLPCAIATATITSASSALSSQEHPAQVYFGTLNHYAPLASAPPEPCTALAHHARVRHRRCSIESLPLSPLIFGAGGIRDEGEQWLGF